MSKLSQIKIQMIVGALVLAIALALLTACALVKPITICHATGDTANPYLVLAVDSAAMNAHRGHPNDIIPAPDCDCPKGTGTAKLGTTSLVTTNFVTTSLMTTSLVATSDGKVTIWHATGSPTNPYTEITVSANGLNGHDKHAGDRIPAPACNCPKRPDATSPGTTSDGKITICHATGSQTNPYTEITVDINGLNGHDKHTGDIIPAPVGGCPKSPVATSPETTNDGKITICHATGSQTNPYTEITVSVNGLNGHDKHEGDIIPAPAGGCPSSGDGKPGNGKSGNDKPGNNK